MNLTKCGRRSPTSWSLNACLATDKRSQDVVFDAADVFSSIMNKGLKHYFFNHGFVKNGYFRYEFIKRFSVSNTFVTSLFSMIQVIKSQVT